MERLFEVTLCKLKFIDRMNEFYQHTKEISKDIKICIMDGEKFVNIESNKEYECLRNPNNKIICSKESLDGMEYVVEVKPYSKESLSENEVSLNYLRAINARRRLNNRTILKQHDKRYLKRK